VNSVVKILSEDGKDVAGDALFLAAFAEAKRAGIPVSCHCDLDGENAATVRAVELAKKAGAHIHIAHASTKEVISLIRKEKSKLLPPSSLLPVTYYLTSEVTPHHLALTEKDAVALGADTFGKVAPPLRSEEDRRALIGGILDGTIDAIATDHAPHTEADKKAGAPGFSGLETAFAVCYTTLVAPGDAAASAEKGRLSLPQLSRLMSASPARILGLTDRGRISAGLRADLCAADLSQSWKVDPEAFKSKGKNSPFAGRILKGKIVMTVHRGRIVT
jgi:dihydroorotase